MKLNKPDLRKGLESLKLYISGIIAWMGNPIHAAIFFSVIIALLVILMNPGGLMYFVCKIFLGPFYGVPGAGKTIQTTCGGLV